MKSYKIKINGNLYDVAINGIRNSVADVTVNGVNYSVELEGGCPASAPQMAATGDESGRNVTSAGSVSPAAPGQVPAQAAAQASAPAKSSAGKAVKSPLPGVIIEVSVKEGETVKRGQKIAVLEAMKMENDILAAQDGTVAKVCVNKGDSVLEGAEIALIS